MQAWRLLDLAATQDRSLAMPSYEYHCSTCQTHFEVEQSVREHAQSLPPCPKCGSAQDVQKQLSSFYAKTSSKR